MSVGMGMWGVPAVLPLAHRAGALGPLIPANTRESAYIWKGLEILGSPSLMPGTALQDELWRQRQGCHKQGEETEGKSRSWLVEGDLELKANGVFFPTIFTLWWNLVCFRLSLKIHLILSIFLLIETIWNTSDLENYSL